MNINSVPENSPLKKTMSRTQSIAILGVFLLMIAAFYGFVSARSSQSPAKRAVAVEMSTVNRDSDSDTAIASVAEAPPSSHEQQVKAEILANMRLGAQSGR